MWWTVTRSPEESPQSCPTRREFCHGQYRNIGDGKNEQHGRSAEDEDRPRTPGRWRSWRLRGRRGQVPVRQGHGVHDRRGGVVGCSECGDTRRCEDLPAGRTRSHVERIHHPGHSGTAPDRPGRARGGGGSPSHVQAAAGLLEPSDLDIRGRQHAAQEDSRTPGLGAGARSGPHAGVRVGERHRKRQDRLLQQPAPEEETPRTGVPGRAPGSGACDGQRQLSGRLPLDDDRWPSLLGRRHH